MLNSPASLSLTMLSTVFSRMVSIKDSTSGNLQVGFGWIMTHTHTGISKAKTRECVSCSA